ncbi:transmembrane protease serine 9-like [Prorops nasuta]|uniref:transmembrane protease serine 9-like n=1 Tax=Prorops nasuta TaxID=863751 RepID=UPI0034CF3DCF
MAIIATFSFLVIVTASQALPYNLTSRIANGHIAKEGEFPFQVSLQNKIWKYHFCAGSIINDYYVLTAASCFLNQPISEILVIAGVINNKVMNFTYEVEQIITWPRYKPNYFWDYNIALLKVKTPFKEVSTIIQYATLADDDEDVTAGERAIVSGWGARMEGESTSNQLLRADVFVVEQTYCSQICKTIGKPIDVNTALCAYNPEDRAGICVGDEGGPLIIHGKIFGIINWSVVCGTADIPAIYTFVPVFNSWIRTTIKSLVMTISAFVCLFAIMATSQAIPNGLAPRIVNGNIAKEGEFPFQVSLRHKTWNYHFCGGSIINEYFVLTSAQCVEGKAEKEILIVAGNINNNVMNFTNEINKIIIHRSYKNSMSWNNNIALLRLKQPFVKVPTIQKGTLPVQGEITNTGERAVISGWGAIREGGAINDELLRTDVFITDQTFCKEMYNKIHKSISDNNLCAYDPKDRKGFCLGDDGGPLTVKGKIVGIINWSVTCGTVDFPAVYTRVSSYIDWITTSIKSEKNIN